MLLLLFFRSIILPGQNRILAFIKLHLQFLDFLEFLRPTFSLLKGKGQIISKGLLVSSNSPKKRTNEFVVVVKTNSFVRFLGEFEDTKSPFEIIWPLIVHFVLSWSTHALTRKWIPNNSWLFELTKGQIISKGLLVSSHSPKKRTNEFVFTTTTNSFVRFLGEFKDTK